MKYKPGDQVKIRDEADTLIGIIKGLWNEAELQSNPEVEPVYEIMISKTCFYVLRESNIFPVRP